MVWVVSLSTMDLITHCLTPIHHIYGIRSLSEFGNPGWAPRPNSALPPRCLYEAIPKYISERTSYLQVRLEFHRYPHLIRSLFNVSRFGPPSSVTWTSTWTWVDHLVSGLRTHTQSPCSDSLSLRLRIICLTLHVYVTRRFILQKARHHPLTGSDYLYAHGFRFYFTPLPGCFSPFPHGTGSLSVTKKYLALGDGPPGFRRNYTCSAVLRIHRQYQ